MMHTTFSSQVWRSLAGNFDGWTVVKNKCFPAEKVTARVMRTRSTRRLDGAQGLGGIELDIAILVFVELREAGLDFRLHNLVS